MWTKPEATEIKMDAEIGSYQSDDRDDTMPPFVTNEEHDSIVG